MADEYWYHSAGNATPDDTLDLLATAIGASRTETGLRRGTSLTAAAWLITDDSDEALVAQRSGVTGPRLTVRFGVRAAGSSPGAADSDLRAVIAGTVALLADQPADAVLISESDVVLRRLHGEIVLNSAWPGWHEIPALAAFPRSCPAHPII